MIKKTCGFDPWAGKIPWGRKWQPTPVYLPGESHGQRSLVGYKGSQRVRRDLGAKTEGPLYMRNSFPLLLKFSLCV